jgi:uncharacterized protein YqgV (UPF0045/DUF77 family)
MHVAVELSLYPLTGEFIPPIQDFIDRLNAHAGIRVQTNSMSTQVSGDYATVMQALQAEIARTFEGPTRAVVVMKVLGGGD